MADLTEAERICDALLWSNDPIVAVLAIVPKARALSLSGKTKEALELLESSESSLAATTRAMLTQGIPKDKTPQFDADKLRANIDSQGEAKSPLSTKNNKKDSQQNTAELRR